jgi:hypothetical protein
MSNVDVDGGANESHKQQLRINAPKNGSWWTQTEGWRMGI